MEPDTQLREFYRYIPNFITEAEEEYLLRKISETPQPKWKNVTNRRWPYWTGKYAPLPGSSTFSKLVVSGRSLTQRCISEVELRRKNISPNIIERLAGTGAFDQSAHKAPNHVIINEYKPGDGIMPHEDGPSYHPVVATISLGSHTLFHYHRYQTSSPSLPSIPKMIPSSPEMVSSSSSDVFTGPSSNGGRAIDPKPVLSILLEPRSVIITSGALYKEYLHCIEEVKEDLIVGADVEKSSLQENEGADALEFGLGSKPTYQKRYAVDNWEAVEDEEIRKVARKGGTLERGTRISLTCRDVEKTRKVGLPGFGQR